MYIQLTYIGDTSNKIRKCLSSCLSKIKCGRVKIIFTSCFSRLKDVFKFKDKQPTHCKSNVIYLITCSCKRKYIGETCNIDIRFNEHVDLIRLHLTEVGKHLRDSPGCQVSFKDSCKILGYESCKYRRKLKESLFIQQFDDGNLINDRLSSVPLFIFGLLNTIEQNEGRVYNSYNK